jgi:hypothetical protein
MIWYMIPDKLPPPIYAPVAWAVFVSLVGMIWLASLIHDE